MAIFNIDLDLEQTQPRNEPKYSRPRRGPSKKAKRPSSTINSPRFKIIFCNSILSTCMLRVVLDVELSITSGLGKTTRRENLVKSDVLEKFEDEPDVDEAFATRIKQEVVLLGTQADTDHVSKLSRPVWPKSSPTIPSSLFKNDFQTEVFLWL